jgi:hypothetical protein
MSDAGSRNRVCPRLSLELLGADGWFVCACVALAADLEHELVEVERSLCPGGDCGRLLGGEERHPSGSTLPTALAPA